MSLDNVSPPAPSTQDALQVLRSDHRRIDALLSDCLRVAHDEQGQAASADRNAFLERLAALLQAHARMEAELFYPALNVDAVVRDSLQLEHDEMLAQLRRLLSVDRSDDEFALRLDTLAERIRHHISVEEAQCFARLSSADLDALGARLAMRRGELLGEQGPD